MKRRAVIPMLCFHPDAPTGSTRVAWDEARFLAAGGWEVWAVCPASRDTDPEFAEVEGVRVLRYPRPHLAALDPRRIRAHQGATTAILRRHLPAAPDAIHGHAPLMYAGALSTAGPATRTAYTVHSPAALEALAASDRGVVSRWASAPLLRHIERKVLQASDVVHVLSRYTRALLRDEHGIPDSRVTVIPGWVDLDRFRPVEDPGGLRRSLGWPGGRVLFTLRRLVPRMGLDRLLRAFARVARSEMSGTLVIGGDGPLRRPLEDLSSALGLGGRVRFEGRVAEDALPAMYAAADAFVLPTAALECFGLIALEALACGRPVLATPVGAIPELIEPLEPRWLSSDATEDALATLLGSWYEGRLPGHAPGELRRFVEARFAATDRLPELAAACVGSAS